MIFFFLTAVKKAEVNLEIDIRIVLLIAQL